MRTFRFDKLVRDEIVPKMIRQGCEVDWHGLKDEEYYQELLKKLAEEIDEAKRSETAEEAADVYEVCDAFELCFGTFSGEYADQRDDFNTFIEEKTAFTEEMIVEAQLEKRQKLGGFSARMYVETVTVPDNYPWISYYLENADRYPEVKTV